MANQAILLLKTHFDRLSWGGGSWLCSHEILCETTATQQVSQTTHTFCKFYIDIFASMPLARLEPVQKRGCS